MRGDRQRFCPACSVAVSSQRPLTGSDTSLCCRPLRVCVCWCIASIASASLASTSLASVSLQIFFYISAFICISSPAQDVYLVSAYFLCLWTAGSIFVRVVRVKGGGRKEAAWCVGQRWQGQGCSLRVFGLGPQLACADWAGAWTQSRK